MKLTYWYAQCLTDSDCYSVRERTRKDCLKVLNDNFPDGWEGEYEAPVKVSVDYESGLDLLQLCTGEGRLYWERVKQ